MGTEGQKSTFGKESVSRHMILLLCTEVWAKCSLWDQREFHQIKVKQSYKILVKIILVLLKLAEKITFCDFHRIFALLYSISASEL